MKKTLAIILLVTGALTALSAAAFTAAGGLYLLISFIIARRSPKNLTMER